MGLSLAIAGSGSLQKELEFWMREMDADRDGAIEYGEFSNMLKRWAARAAFCCGQGRGWGTL